MEEQNGILGKAGKLEKLENPARVAELAPEATLRRIGLGPDDAVCDVGAGSGLFSLAAARLTRGAVFALDTDAEILGTLARRAAAEGLSQLRTVPVSGVAYPLPDGACDLALLVTVLHEISERDALAAELGRLLRPSGRVCLIEFRAESTPMGPPPERRVGAEAARALFARHGFAPEREFLLGSSFYCQVYTRRV